MEKEEDIIEAVKRGKKSFEVLYNKHFESVFRFVYSRVEAKSLAQDITADVFVKAYQNIEKYEAVGKSFGGWLYRIAYNEVMNYYRKTKQQEYVALTNQAVFTLSEELVVDQSTINEQFVAKLFSALPKQDVALLRMRFFEGLAFKEIAACFSLKESAVKMKLYRILEKVKGLDVVVNFNK